jgi:uncharacterized protein YndB with AHSA1/START domain
MIELNRICYLSSVDDQRISITWSMPGGSKPGLSDGNRAMLPLTVTP